LFDYNHRASNEVNAANSLKFVARVMEITMNVWTVMDSGVRRTMRKVVIYYTV